MKEIKKAEKGKLTIDQSLKIWIDQQQMSNTAYSSLKSAKCGDCAIHYAK